MSIENPTLAHFRHFSSLFTNLPAYKALYVRAYKVPDIYVPIRHYICREPSTNQLLFMQNKPNVKYAQINVISYMKSKYEKLDTWLSGKNKPNSNPIKPNLQKAQMNVNLYVIEDYRKKDDFLVRINKPNFRNGQNERKYLYHKGLQKKRLFSSTKNKPNSNPIKACPVLAEALSAAEGAVEWANFFEGQNELKIACREIQPHPQIANGCNNFDFCLWYAYTKAVFARRSKMRFTKMQGLGNDYVYVNCFEEKIEDPAKLAQIVSDRHSGIGADGLILIGASQTADVQMRIFNADGSEAEMCGNGIRCVAKYAYEHKLAQSRGLFPLPDQPPLCSASLKIETGNGVLTVGLMVDDRDKVQRVCVNMGQPVLTPKDIPVNLSGEKTVEQHIEILGQELLMTCVSMGNPHAIFFCDNVELIKLEKLGPAIENNSLFPNRVNVHFVQIDKPTEFTMRTWERGSGVTMACGSGACAACVAAVLTGRCERICAGHLPGGDLNLNWCQEDNCLYMTGPAVEVFEGVWPEK